MLLFACIRLSVSLSLVLALQSSDFKIPANPEKCLEEVDKISEKLNKYQYLRDLQNTNEDLFYSCLIKNVNELLPIVYTPVVGEVCQKYGTITGPKRGITLAITEADKIKEHLLSWKEQHSEVKAIVVTDGGRILGLGDLGANGMGIPVGKMIIYSALGGVHPDHCLPITLDVGTNTEHLRESDFYVGLRQGRPEKEAYENFVDKFMTSVVDVFGPRTLIQFEDFGNKNAFAFLKKYRDHYTMFNDDIQGTAAVTLAGILAAERATNMKLENSKVLIVGAGEAGIGIANIMVEAMVEAGIDRNKAIDKIYMKNSKGLIMDGGVFNEDDETSIYRKFIPKDVPHGSDVKNLLEIVKWLKPNILIGVSARGGIFTKEVLEEMGKNNDAPIIFALSNPLANSECTAHDAYTYTEGRAIFASGSPFNKVTLDGKTYEPKQCNNAYIFPGVALAITATRMTTVPNEVFLIAAKTLAHECTKEEDFMHGSLFPKLERLRDCSVQIATNIAKYAFLKKLSSIETIPEDNKVKDFILNYQYTPSSLHSR